MTREKAIKIVRTIKEIVNYNTSHGMTTSKEAWEKALALMDEFNITAEDL